MSKFKCTCEFLIYIPDELCSDVDYYDVDAVLPAWHEAYNKIDKDFLQDYIQKMYKPDYDLEILSFRFDDFVADYDNLPYECWVKCSWVDEACDEDELRYFLNERNIDTIDDSVDIECVEYEYFSDEDICPPRPY